MRSTGAIATLALLLSSASSVLAQAMPTPSAAPPPPGMIDYLRSEMQKRKIPGLQLAVVRNGQIVQLGAFGVANIEQAVEVTNETVFPINSCTKAFTGVAIMQLVEAGKLDLNSPISRYLDDLPEEWRPISVKQLATHVSGLPDILNPRTDRIIGGDGDPQSAWEKVQTLPVSFKPGERVSYNQTNYLLLGKLIEKASGQPFTDFITTNQFAAAGMSRTAESGFTDSRDIAMNSVESYTALRPVGGKWIETDRLYRFYFERAPFLRAATGINSTADEVARWIIALQQMKLLKKSASIEAMWTPAVLNDGKRGEWAVGWPIVERPEHRVVRPTGGSRSAIAIYPDDDLAVVILTNLLGSRPEQFIDEVAAFYIPDMHAATGFGLPLPVKPLHAELVKRGFEHASAVAQESRIRNRRLKLSEEDVRSWAFTLLGRGQRDDALAIFKLNAELHPRSPSVYETLGAVYDVLGDSTRGDAARSRSNELKGSAR